MTNEQDKEDVNPEEFTILFQNNEKVKHIPFMALKETRTLANYDNELPKNRPVEHHEFITTIVDILQKRKLEVGEIDIIVDKEQSNRLRELDPENKGVLRSWLFYRVIGKIPITNIIKSEDNDVAIAFSYTEDGIEVTWGVNTWACDNLAIFGENRAATFGRDKVDEIEVIYAAIDLWARFMHETGKIHFKFMDDLADIDISYPKEAGAVIGILMTDHQRYVCFKGQKPIIPSSTMIVAMWREMVRLYHKDNNYITALDILNLGTYFMKAGNLDTTKIIPTTRRYCNWVIDYFGVEAPPEELPGDEEPVTDIEEPLTERIDENDPYPDNTSEEENTETSIN